MPEVTSGVGKGDGGKCEKGAIMVTTPSGEQKKLKPCCACPETKRVRDQCIMEYGEENCQKLIQAHLECMRGLGFKI